MQIPTTGKYILCKWKQCLKITLGKMGSRFIIWTQHRRNAEKQQIPERFGDIIYIGIMCVHIFSNIFDIDTVQRKNISNQFEINGFVAAKNFHSRALISSSKQERSPISNLIWNAAVRKKLQIFRSMGDGEGRIRTIKAWGFKTLTERTILSKLILWAANGHFVTSVEYYAQPSVQFYTRLWRVP